MLYQITFVESENRINCPTMEIALEISNAYIADGVSCCITKLEEADVYC